MYMPKDLGSVLPTHVWGTSDTDIGPGCGQCRVAYKPAPASLGSGQGARGEHYFR